MSHVNIVVVCRSVVRLVALGFNGVNKCSTCIYFTVALSLAHIVTKYNYKYELEVKNYKKHRGVVKLVRKTEILQRLQHGHVIPKSC